MAKGPTRSFRYQERSKDDLKERANAKGGNFDDYILPKYKKYKVRDGKNLIRILPPTWDQAKHYGYDIWLNYNIGPDNQAYLSLAKMKNERNDPIAEAAREAANEGDDKLRRELLPRQRILMWVIDRNEEDEGPQLWACPQTVDKAFANLSFDQDTGEVIYIDDPEQGCDVRFFKEGTGLKTDYDASKMRLMKPSPLSEDPKLMDEWLDYAQQNPVPECLHFYDCDYIASIFNGTPNKPKDEDAPPPKAVKTSRQAPEPDDDDPAPAPRARARAVMVEDADEAPTPRRPIPKSDDEDEAPEGESIRQRIARRRAAASAVEED